MRKRVLFWIPRITSVLFVAFLSLLSLDVLHQPHWQIALFIHLIPSYLFAILAVISWNFEDGGGLLYLLAGILLYLGTHSIILSFIPVIIGVLFLLSHTQSDRNKIDWQEHEDI